VTGHNVTMLHVIMHVTTSHTFTSAAWMTLAQQWNQNLVQIIKETRWMSVQCYPIPQTAFLCWQVTSLRAVLQLTTLRRRKVRSSTTIIPPRRLTLSYARSNYALASERPAITALMMAQPMHVTVFSLQFPAADYCATPKCIMGARRHMNSQSIDGETKCVPTEWTAEIKVLQKIHPFQRAHYNYSVLCPVGMAAAAVKVTCDWSSNHYMSRPTVISQYERCFFCSFQG
jgi:hypothetical protein